MLDSPDNLCVTPSGAILFCEDDSNPTPGHVDDTHPLADGITNVNRLIGLSRDGLPFEFAVNVFGNQNPASGMTCAISGPWRKGPL